MVTVTKSKNDPMRMIVPQVRAETELTAGFATPVEAAKFLRLSKAMVHKLIAEGRMPACRYGRAVRIPWTWLWAETGK